MSICSLSGKDLQWQLWQTFWTQIFTWEHIIITHHQLSIAQLTENNLQFAHFLQSWQKATFITQSWAGRCYQVNSLSNSDNKPLPQTIWDQRKLASNCNNRERSWHFNEASAFCMIKNQISQISKIDIYTWVGYIGNDM